MISTLQQFAKPKKKGSTTLSFLNFGDVERQLLIFLFSKVVYKILYERNSSGDIGTLYQVRNFLHATNSPHHPMDDPDAAIDFIEKYTIALVLACYKTSESCLRVEESRLKHGKEQAMEKILSHIADTYALFSCLAYTKRASLQNLQQIIQEVDRSSQSQF